ncbi:MAG TPA: hypothetical protein VF214_09915 [Edaphobacter sp.]
MKTLTRFAFVAIAIGPVCAAGQQCKRTQFTGIVTSQQGYSHEFAPNLLFRLTPLKANWGWVISIGPKDSDEDWSFPVNFPLRTGENQLMGTGYGNTVQDRLAFPTRVQLVLTHSEFIEYSRMAIETLESPRPEAAGEYIQKVDALTKGQATVKVLEYEKGETAETVKSMNFNISIIVPVSFQAPDTTWEPTPCPAARIGASTGKPAKAP